MLLTQQQLAKEADISTRTIRRLESGETNASLETLKRLACVLDVDWEQLTVNDAVGQDLDRETYEGNSSAGTFGKPFPNRKGRIFGRSPDVEYLLSLACSSGLTAVRARPKMGKTWLVQEVGRVIAHPVIVFWATTNAVARRLIPLRGLLLIYTRDGAPAAINASARLKESSPKISNSEASSQLDRYTNLQP